MPTPIQPGPTRVGEKPVAAPTSGKSGTLTTSQGPITWTQSSDGTIAAEGGGQTLTASGQAGSDGSWQKHAAYARTGAAPYLTMESVGDVAGRKVAFTLGAGSSQLTLTVATIDARATSGTATLSGSWNGAAVNWTSPVNLNSNPFVTRPIAGWPAGAFANELQQAALFSPVGTALAPTLAPPPRVTTGSGVTLHRDSPGGVISRAGAWCMGGAIAGSNAGPETWGTSVLLGCAGGVVASLANDLATWLDDDDSVTPTVPVIDLPLPPEPTGPVTQTQPDDPPPPAPGGGTDTGDDGGGGGGGGDEGDGGGGGDGGGVAGPGKDDRAPLKPD